MFLRMVCLAKAVVAITSLPPQSAQSILTQTKPYTQDGALAAASNTNVFTLTTVTTQWGSPSFATASPLPLCNDNMCPTLDGRTCIDAMGATYGILCNQRMTGIAITSSGKKDRLMRDVGGLGLRSYTGSLDACAAKCDDFDKQFCTGFEYLQGTCTIFDSIAGTVPQNGAIACVRQT